MALSEKEKEEKRKYYLERHLIHEKWHESLSHNLDKLIFGLSSGAIILSVTFIDKIIGVGEIQSLYLITISWEFLFATLVANILTYIFSMQASVKSREVLRDWLNNDRNDTPITYNWIGKTANILNIISLFSLTLGIFFLTYFAITNINARNTMNNKQTKQEEKKIEKAASKKQHHRKQSQNLFR